MSGYGGLAVQIDSGTTPPTDIVTDAVEFLGPVTMSGGVSPGPGATASITGAAQTVTPDSADSVLTIDATTNDAFTVAVPSGTPGVGQSMRIIIKNTSGGAMGAVTFAAAYMQPAAYTEPATGTQNVITIFWDGTNWNFASVSADLS